MFDVADLQGFDEPADVAFQKAVERVERKLDAMVGDAVLGEIIGADFFLASPSADEAAPVGGVFFLLLAAFVLEEPGAHDFDRCLLVLLLAASILASNNPSGRDVHDLHSGVGGVHTLATGDIGYVIANIKTSSEVKVGDTLTNARQPADEPLPGFQVVQPMVFSGIYPINTADFEHLKAAIAKLQLNDAAFQFMAESSVALGFGFRCGFLGLLHMEIIIERLRREFDMDIIATYPSVIYEVQRTNGEVLRIDNPDQLPDPSVIEEIREPMVRCFVMLPNEYISPILQLIMEKRGEVSHTESIDTKRVMLTADLPLNEILVDFVDKMKSITRGYGSMDYEQAGYKPAKLVKLEMLVNAEPVDAFSSIVHREKAESRGRALATKLKEVIPQQLYQVAIQAAVGGKIVARESVSAMRKNVTAKCYGGDISRKRKLLEKQKEGKKRMKAVGTVNIPQEAFIEVLRTS